MKRFVQVVALLCFLCLLAFAALWSYATFWIDGTVKLERGRIIDELLLGTSPIRHFPETLVPGDRTYFFSSGEAGRDAIVLLIKVTERQSEYLEQCVQWLRSCGYKTSTSIHFPLEMTNSKGSRAQISADQDGIQIRVEE